MTVIAGMTLLLCQAVLGDEPTRVQRLAPRRAMLCRGDDQAAHQQRKADEEKREDTAAVKVSKRADDLGGVHDQEPNRLHPEAGSPVQDADYVQHQHGSDQEPGANKYEFPKRHDALPIRRLSTSIPAPSRPIVPARRKRWQ